jgi:cytochrome c-type biogenesis protein CcmE
MKPEKRREKIFLILGSVCVLAAIAAFVVNAFQSNLLYFFSPAQIAAGEAPVGKLIRVGGHVRTGSIRPLGYAPRFEIADGTNSLPVFYDGSFPALFAEGQGAVVQGRIDARGAFIANEVLARHDENYRPALRGAGG